MSRRFQFSLRAMLVVMLVVAAFFGGMAMQRNLDKPVRTVPAPGIVTVSNPLETLVLPDGSRWLRVQDD